MRSIALRWPVAATALFAMLLAACQPATPPMTPKEQAHMRTLTDHMTPRCFGRYLIDLPVDMKAGRVFGTKIEDVDIKVTPMAKGMFDMQLAERKAVLEKKRVVAHPEWADLESVTPLTDQSGVIFNRTDGGMTRGSRTLEVHGWKDGYAIKMQIDASEDNFPEYKNDPPNLRFGTDTPQKLTLLQALYARTRGRTNDEIPNEPGTCFQSGFVSGPASDEVREDIAMDFVSKSMLDVMIHLESDSGMREKTTLLDRMDNIKAAVSATSGRIARKGSIESKSGFHFDEVLFAGITTDDHVKGGYFTLEANSKIGSAKTPMIDIDFWNGQREGYPAPDDPTQPASTPDRPPLTKASLSEAESIDLWDAITRTLRPRPGAF